jgi:histidinol-phosphate aminotransferase
MIYMNNNESYRSPLTPEELTEIVRNAEIHRYPAGQTEQFIQAYGEFFQLPPSSIAVRNGSDEWIQQICLFLAAKDRPVMMLDPDFSMYKICAEQFGRFIVTVPADPNFSFSIKKILKTIEEAKPSVFFLSNPHNPTGTLFPTEWLLQCAEAMEKAEGYFILDEAYYGFVRQEEPINWLNYDHVIRLRTMSKSFGLAGLRIGIAIAPEPTLKQLQKYQLPYPVNHLSTAIGTALLQQKEKVEAFWKEQREAKSQLERILKKVADRSEQLFLLPSHSNYFFLYGKDAVPFAKFCMENGFLPRLFSTETLKESCRFSIISPTDLISFEKTAERWIPSYATSKS